MKKITLKVALATLMFTGWSSVSAQSKSASPSQSSLQQSVNIPSIQLNEESRNSLSETGYVKCASVEMNERRMQREGHSPEYYDAFEEWLAPLIEAKKAQIAEQKANGTFRRAVVTIPIVFHVITSGGNHATNLSQAQIQAQVDQLNLDFSNQAGSTHPDAADAMVQFAMATVDPGGNPLAEPGINRVTTFGAGPFPTTDFDQGDGGLEIKPNTIWDRSQYANIWVANISGGILGYAQFPSNSTLPGFNVNGGSALNDGVVIGYGTVGSVANPGSAPPYNLGRTLTHEIGHWIGLRHIWGDGGCSVDDYCNDTPTAGAANYGTGQNNSCGSADMVENYMDYTDDVIMNIFTNDQVTRITTVVENATGISDLPDSTTSAPLTPTVVFQSVNSSQAEGSACSYTDVTTAVSLSVAATGTTNISFSVTGGTATNNTDFELLTSSVSFASGATGTRDMTVRVYHDAFVEGDETVQIGFTVTGSDANAGSNNTLTLTISDDDTVPATTQNVTLFSDDFESHTDFAIANIGNWTLIDNDGDATWGSDNTNFTNEGYTGSFIVFNPGATTPASNAGWNSHGGSKGFYCFNSNGSVSGTPLNDDMAITPVIANGTNGQINFWAKSLTDNYNGGERFRVGVSATNDGSGITYVTPNPYVIPPTDPWTEYTYNIPSSFDNQNVYVVIHVVSADEFVFMMDDISITADVTTPIQTAVNNATTNDQFNLPNTGSVYTSDSSSGDLMLDITNNNSFDYGCTTSSVFRAGTSAQAYNGSVAPNLVMDKVFDIKPSNIATSEDATVKFYFTDAEIQGWLTANPGRTINDIVAYRDSGSEIVALTATAFGANHTLTGNFTGLNGQYYFGAIEAFQKVSLSPRVALQGALLNNGGGSLMRDDLRVAGLIPTTSPYADGATCNATVFNTTGNNAIVDWVWVELRDENDNTSILHSKSALLQRDGDVVGLDGSSVVEFETESKNYFVVINHRNHLGIMSSTSIALSSSNTVVDFTDANNQITHGTDAQTTFGVPSGVVAMWAGDANGDGRLNYLGTFTENTSIRTQVMNDPSNSVFGAPPVATYASVGYHVTDVDMDGNTKYLGSSGGVNSDAVHIRNNTFNNPSNSVFGGPPSATYVFDQQLP